VTRPIPTWRRFPFRAARCSASAPAYGRAGRCPILAIPERCRRGDTPFAIDPGTGGEDTKFRPVPEPRSLDPAQRHKAELAVDIENRHHLTWASQQAASFVLAENDWRASIESQGVMEAVWLVATTYEHADDTRRRRR